MECSFGLTGELQRYTGHSRFASSWQSNRTPLTPQARTLSCSRPTCRPDDRSYR